MNCNECHRQFNSHSNVPRLLVLCGHSLCQACCVKIHSNCRIQCPQCHSYTYVDAISLLPKNLALLSVTNIQTGNTCTKHNKKYEAFCQKQKILICVDCILEDGYRKNPMQSIKNAYIKQYQKFNKSIIKINTFYETLLDKLNQNQNALELSQQNYVNIQLNITSIFKYIRELVDSQEQQLVTKFKQSYTSCEKKIMDKNVKYAKIIQRVEKCLENLRMSESQTEVIFLQNTNNRQLQIETIPNQIDQPIKAFNYTISKVSITQSIIKTLQKSIKNISQQAQSQNKKTTETITGKVIKKINNVPNNKYKKNPKRQSNPITYSSGNHQRNTSNVLQKYDINSKCDISAVEQKQSMINSFLSSMTCLLNEKKSIHIVGGLSQDANNVIKLNLTNLSWQETSLMNSNRSKFGAVAINKDILVFGGKKGKQRVADGEIYNGCWMNGFTMGRVRSGFGLVNIGHILYFIGGNDGQQILSSVQCLNLETGEWSKKKQMLQPRDELSVVVGNDNKIYAIGGFGGNNSQPLNSVEVYDHTTNKWTYAPPMNFPRRALAASTLADGIYAIGGFDGSAYMNSVEKYQQGSKEWVITTPMKQARCTHSAVAIIQSQQIYVFGGFDYVALDSVQKFSVVTNEWEPVCRMPAPRFMHSSVLIRQ